MPRGRGRTGSNRRRVREQGERPQMKRPSSTPSVDITAPRPHLLQTGEVRRLLTGIGQPPPKPFKPDPFQLQALAALETDDVLVTAPTGSGKTWIAQEEIRGFLNSGKKAS